MKIASHFLTVTSLAVLTISSTMAAEFDHSHRLFDKVLKRLVKDALVDYSALKQNPAEFTSYLKQLAAVPESEFNRWNEREQIAFLINAYNAYTLKLIIENYPVQSIKDIGGRFKGPFQQPVVSLFGRTLTLEAVEHQMLRKNYAEPRVHFALVCAALGCPPLREEAYTADKLDQQLDDQGRKFLGIRTKNRVDASQRVAHLSPIFKWFRGDFEKKSGSVLKFIAPYFPDHIRAELAKGDFKIKYTSYDWSLNATKLSF